MRIGLTDQSKETKNRPENLNESASSPRSSKKAQLRVIVKEGEHTSTIRILTKSCGSAASAKAAVEPVIPTETPHRRLQIPTVRPPQKSAKPDLSAQGPRRNLRSVVGR